MKFEPPVNINYAATVVRVRTLVPLEGMDNVVGLPMFGQQAIVGKDTQIGQLGLLFPAETQLSEEFCSANNLYRHSELNADPKVKGYLDDNRRVRAIKFGKGVHRSDALFMPLSSLSYLGIHDFSPFEEGLIFDKIDGEEICRKYFVPVKEPRTHGTRLKIDPRVDEKFLPVQSDTAYFLRVAETLNPWAHCVVTQKLHGTQIRIANTIVKRNLSWRDKVAKSLGVAVQETTFDMVYGSHRVIKDPNNPRQAHFYDEDLWTATGEQFDGLIPENFILYGEVIGWTDGGKPIQKNYTYNCPPKTREVYIYRVAFVNAQGTVVDLSWPAVKEFCASIGAKHVPELWQGTVSELLPTVETWLEQKFYPTFPQAVPLSAESPCDEGVCVRIEGMSSLILKAKSPTFLQHETKMIDKGEEDMEATEEAI